MVLCQLFINRLGRDFVADVDVGSADQGPGNVCSLHAAPANTHVPEITVLHLHSGHVTADKCRSSELASGKVDPLSSPAWGCVTKKWPTAGPFSIIVNPINYLPVTLK